ncbi:hypothetical protein [Nocardia brasiliensis]|uniref:hypothetical protein n=1 Tax=Nocardia brasiliensis TaxID=37326 RepID=UPI0024568722|nr:hypothetical protein [Nocardia brasiliensis]
MSRRRGFFAELQHQQRLAQQREEQRQRAAVRAHGTAVREAQRFAREQQRFAAAAMRASAAERTAAEKAAKAALIAAREAEVTEMNAQLAVVYDEIDGLLEATLDVDDWVDLESLRKRAADLPFDRADLLAPCPPPHYHICGLRPIFVPPAPPTGLTGALGGNRKHAAQVEAARHEYVASVRAWEQSLVQVLALNAGLRDCWRQREQERAEALGEARERHRRANSELHRRTATSNAKLDRLIAGLRARRADAMDEYVGIVLANSVYPEAFQVAYEHTFNPDDRELHITVLAPHPNSLPITKAFRYNKTNDQITATNLPTADVKRRYASALAQTALRTAHEVFEADREEIIDSIALTVAVDTVDSATGHDIRVDLVRLATDRAQFLTIHLARVEPADTLAHLASAVSKNPYALLPLANQGVRG